MPLRRDHIVIIDVESTCWENRAVPPGQQSEIVEIGVCLFDVETWQPSGRRSILVKPRRSTVSAFCTQLTTLTQEQVDSGVGFAEACALLEADYLTLERAWASWGNYDRKMFAAQCESFEVRYPFNVHHTNLKTLFAKLFVKQKWKQVGMARALEIAGLPLEGTHHRGGDDAWNIARLLQYMLQQRGGTVLKKFWK
jgi:inhibitor of KinA sporulation pathway (predicted exonuclease)